MMGLLYFVSRKGAKARRRSRMNLAVRLSPQAILKGFARPASKVGAKAQPSSRLCAFA
ncbi:MAG TPA: hypothetical protein VHO04_00750 [Sphingopyxis sp.]|nr:hypothetical protein [Sphingopyxis sp.]